MVVIPIGIAVLAATVLTAYNSARSSDQPALTTKIGAVRQAAGVIGAMVSFVLAVLDALAGVRTAFAAGSDLGRPRLGAARTVADDPA